MKSETKLARWCRRLGLRSLFFEVSKLVSLIGGYVPGLILDPEEGIDAAIYAKNKAIDYSFKEDDMFGGIDLPPGFQAGEGDGEDVNGVKVFGNTSLNMASHSIG